MSKPGEGTEALAFLVEGKILTRKILKLLSFVVISHHFVYLSDL
jgi:hypothetical protein